MLRPVRPVALVILTACMLYPGVTMLYQGLYPFVAQDWFNLVGERGPWMDLALRFGIPLHLVSLAKAAAELRQGVAPAPSPEGPTEPPAPR